MGTALQSLLPLSVCLVLSALLTPVARVMAGRLGLLDKPSAHKAHETPTPLMGGTAMFAALAIGAVASGLLTGRMAGIVLAATLLFGLGLWDDARGMAPKVKFLGQLLAVGLAVSLGLVARVAGTPLLDIPLTLLWLVGLTNSLNLLDNMDGISSGVAAVVAVFFFFAATVLGDGQVGAVALCLAGAALGFLIYNFPPATIFLGDSGSMVYGFVLAALGILLMNEARGPSEMLAPCALMALPTLDTTLVTVTRRLEGRDISQGGKDHMSHRMAALGASARTVAWAHYGLAAAFGTAGIAYLLADAPARIALVVSVLSAAVFLGVALSRVPVEAGGVARSLPLEG